jgi:hypothetical protein
MDVLYIAVIVLLLVATWALAVGIDRIGND